MSSELFSIKVASLTIQIPLEIAKQGLTLKAHLENFDQKELEIPDNLKLKSKEILKFFDVYNKFLYNQDIIECLTLEELVYSATVADYLGYETVIINNGTNEKIPLLDLLINQLTKRCLLNNLSNEFYDEMSRTIKDLINLKLNDICFVSLGDKRFLIEDGEIKPRIVTNGKKPGIAGFLHYLKKETVILYTDIIDTDTDKVGNLILPSYHCSYEQIHLTDDKFYKINPYLGLLEVSSLHYYHDTLSLDKYSLVITTSNTMDINISLLTLNSNIVPENLNISLPHGEFKLLKYSDMFLVIYPNSYLTGKIINMIDLKNGKEVFTKAVPNSDKYMVDDTGQYLLIYEYGPKCLELYDIFKKRKLFEKSLKNWDVCKDLILDIHNKIVTISLEVFVLKFDFQGNDISQIPDINIGGNRSIIPLHGLDLVINNIGTETDNEKDIPVKDYQALNVSLRDCRTGDVKETLSLINSIDKSDVTVSPDGMNFTITCNNTVNFYRVVTEDDRERVRKMLF